MKVLREIGKVVVCCVLIAVIPAILAVLFRDSITLPDLAKHYRYSLIYTFCIGIPAWLIVEPVSRLVWKKNPVFRIATLIAMLAALALVGSFAANLIFLAIGWLDRPTFWPEFAIGLRIAVFMTISLGVTMTFFEVMKARLDAATEELRARQLEEERARQLITEARLSSLESRIHPHFLFNTLNSITALIREDPRKAERTVERLAVLLRYSLDHTSRGLVPLRRELHVVEDYLEIEKTRFGERLHFTMDVPAELADLEVPALALQTLVENSIKHAVSPNRQGGDIIVAARMDAGNLVVEVSDDGPGFERVSIEQGHGLENLQERLTALFAGEGHLDIGRRDGRMVVGVSIPQKKVLA
jgi:two-component system, LytTR family, sensor histidine kinase AlgZ